MQIFILDLCYTISKSVKNKYFTDLNLEIIQFLSPTAN